MKSKPKAFSLCRVLFAVVALAGASLHSPEAFTRTVVWGERPISCVTNPGSSTEINVELKVDRPVRGASVWVVPEVAENIKVSPSHFPHIEAGQTVVISVTCHASTRELLGDIDGTIHLRQNRRTLARPAPIRVSIVASGQTLPYSTLPDPKWIVQDPDRGIYPVNQLGVALASEATEEDARRITEDIGGTLIGFIRSGNIYQVELPTRTISELEYWRNVIDAKPLVEFTFLNTASTVVSQSTSDLDELATHTFDDRPATWAYDDIRVRDAWNAVTELGKAPARPVSVGVVDTGIDISHPEFDGVNVLTRQKTDDGAALCRVEPIPSHGTDVAGIIGANNWVGQGNIWRYPEMNGILPGISNLDYSLIAPEQKGLKKVPFLRFWEREISFDLSFLERMQITIDEGAKIVNVSMNSTRCGVLPPTGCEDNPQVSCEYTQCLLDNDVCLKEEQFDSLIKLYDRFFADNDSSVLFVLSAGNFDIDVMHTLPGGINAWRPEGQPHDNVISVAASALRPFDGERPDGDVHWMDFSNYGDGIDIAAPGEGIWAPTKYEPPLGEDDYGFFAGTSGAAPMVTGVAAMLMAMSEEELSPSEIKSILRETAVGGPCRKGGG